MGNEDTPNKGQKRKAVTFTAQGCPYRGMRTDPELRLTYPSDSTYCFKAEPPAPVVSEHQFQYCISPEFVDCPVYKLKEAGRLPETITRKRPSATSRYRPNENQGNNRWLAWLIGGVLLVGLAAWAFTQFGNQNNEPPVEDGAVLVTESAENQVASLDPTATNTPTELPPTNTPAPTNTNTPIPATETPAPSETPLPEPSATPTDEPTPTADAPPETNTPEPTATATPEPITLTIDQDGVNVRRGPSIGYSIVADLDEAGTVFEVLGRSEGGSWLNVCCVDDISGWVSVTTIDFGGRVADLPIQPSPEPIVEASVPIVNVRSGPGLAYEQIGTIEAGETYQVIEQNGAQDWWHICCLDGDITGWVYSEPVRFDGPAQGIPTTTVPRPTAAPPSP